MRTATRMVVLGRKLWTPAALGSSLALWLDSDDVSTITLNGSTVSQWRDKSGNGRHASQADSANQPTYSATGLNGKPVLTFDGVNDFLSFQGVHDQIWSLAVVGRATNNNQGFVQFGLTNQFGSLFVSDGFYRARPSGLTVATVPFTAGEIAVLTATYGATQTNIWKNGAIGTTTAEGGVSSNAGSVIGTLGGIYFLDGNIGEIIALNGVLSTTDRQTLEGYLAHKWGLTADLPINHLFKFTPPYI